MPRGVDTSRDPARRPGMNWKQGLTSTTWGPGERGMYVDEDAHGDFHGTLASAIVTQKGDRFGARAEVSHADPDDEVLNAEGRSKGYRTPFRAQVAAEGIRSQLIR